MNPGVPDVPGIDDGHAEASVPNHDWGELPKSGWIAATLIGIGAALRILSYHYSDNAGGDAWARTGLTAQWLKHPKFQVIFGDYPPGHFWLIGLLNFFIHDVTVASRLLSLILGILTLFVFWKLAQCLCGNAAALLSLVGFTFYSLHIGYSSTSSAEATYLFFLLAGMAFFFVAPRDESRRVWMLALAGLSLSVAETIRLEAWVIFFALGLALLFWFWGFSRSQTVAKSKMWSVLTFGVTGGAAPAFLMVYSCRMFGDPMRALTLHNVVVIDLLRDHPVPLTYQLAVTPVALLLTLSPFVLLGAIYGLFKSFVSKSGAVFVTITLFFALVQQWEIIRGKLLAMSRYSLTLGTLLAVISGYGLVRLASAFPPERRGLIHTVVVASVVLNTLFVLGMSEVPSRFSEKFASISPRLRYAKRISNAGNYLRAHMGAEDAVIIDDYNSESNIIAMAAGLSLLHGRRAYLESARNELTPPEYIAQQRPRFLVFSDQGTLRHWLPLPRECKDAEISGARYHCVFSNQTYRIYEVSYY
jgi:Dolichyl-phosphate-mannose-protein mannosyltransferase